MLRHVLHVACRQKLGPLALYTAGHIDCSLRCVLSNSLRSIHALTALPAAAPSSPSRIELVLSGCPPAGSRSITAKVPKSTDETDEQQLLQKHAAFSETLQKLGLSFSAMMAVLKQGQRRRLNLKQALVRIKVLQDYFGQSLTSDMLTLSPELLERDPQRLIQYFEGLVQVLDGKRPFTLSLLKKAPDIVQHKPEMVQTRLNELQQILQVDKASILSLVGKAPVLLKVRTQKLIPHLEFLSEVAGLTAPDVYKVFHSWPVLASTSINLVKERYRVLSELLQATPEEMRRICRVYPNMLGRDTAQISNNIDALTDKLRVPKDQLLQMVRDEPGLLSFNVSTLVNRIMAASQILKLTQKLSLTLLTYNRPIINVVSQLPQRLEALRRITGVADAELYPMIHKHLNIMRFPVESNEAKMTSVSSLSLLHPAWTAEWKVQPLYNKLRELSAGWGCHWRLVYLVHTGQQGSTAMARAIRVPHAKFRALYPDFPEWLERYNQAVSAADIPINAPLRGPLNLIGPSTYQAVLADASMGKGLHAGSLYVRRKVKQGGMFGSPKQQASWVGTAAVSSSSNDSSSDSSSSSSDSEAEGEGQRGNVDAIGSSSSSVGSASAGLKQMLPATPAGRLAAWLGIQLAAAEQLLKHPRLRTLRWSEWQARMAAAASFLGAVAHQPVAAAAERHTAGTLNPQSSSCNSTSSSWSAVAVAGSAAADLSSPLLHEEAVGQGGQHAQLHPAQQTLAQRQSQQQHGVEFAPHPLGQKALQHAAQSRHAAAVAGVSVACLLVPFAQQLYSTPPKPPDYVVQFVLQHPDIFTTKLFVENCTRLATLTWSSAAFQQKLQQMPQQRLHRLMGCISTRLKLLHYLVQTQQPMPWPVELDLLLLGAKWRGKAVRKQFVETYPGYEQWEQFHMQEL